MTARRDLKIFITLNSYGVIFVVTIILGIISVGFYSLSNTEYTFRINTYNSHYDSGNSSYIAYINLASSSFPPLMGLLGGGFYFHNISLPVIRNSRYPEKNARDIVIGYVLVLFTYIISGCLGYFGFAGRAFESENPMGPAGIQQNVLNMF